MTIYYRNDIRRATFAELWRISSSYSSFLYGCKVKILGLKLPVSCAFRQDEKVVTVPPETVPQEASAYFQPMIEDLKALGAEFAFYTTTPTVGKVEGYSVVMLSKDRYSYFSIVWVQVRLGGRPRGPTFGLGVTSQLQDGSFFTTTNLPRTFNSPPQFRRAQRVVDGTPAVLFERHQKALGEFESPAIRIQGEAHVRGLMAEVKRTNFEWKLQRGVCVLLTPEEKKSLGIRDDE